MYLMHHFYIFATALFMALIMVPSIRRWAIDAGALDMPGDRKVHDKALPRVGGVAIFIPFLFAVLVYFEMTREVRGILAGSLIIFFTGLVDDLYGLSPKQKFLGQIASCLVAISVGHLYVVSLGDLLGFGPIVFPLWLAIPFTVFAVVGVVNAFNFIDGLDGLAGGISIIALTAFFVLGLQERDFTILALSSGMLGALLGFLKYNAFPARIFMGDTGSLVIGFVLAFMAVFATQKTDSNISPIVAFIILCVPLTDTLLVMLNRIRKGKNPLSADNTHVHHKILSLGLDHRFAVFVIYGTSLFWALFALGFQKRQEFILCYVYLAGSIIYYLFLHFLLLNKERLQTLISSTIYKLERFKLKLNLSRLGDFLNIGLLFFVIIYLFSAISVCKTAAPEVLHVSLLVLLLSLGLFYFCNEFNLLLALMYFTGIMITFHVEQVGHRELFYDITVNQFTNNLFLMGSFLLFLCFVLLKNVKDFFNTYLDFLFLGMSLSLAVVSPELDISYHLSGVISKGIILFLALKLINVKKLFLGKAVACCMLITLLIITVRGYLLI